MPNTPASSGGSVDLGALLAPFSPLLVASESAFAANEARGVRCVAAKAGVITDLAVYVSTTGGNIDIGIYDVALTTRTALYRKGSAPTPAGGWRIIAAGSTGISCAQGDQFDLVVGLDGAVQRVGMVFLGAAGISRLPAGFVAVAAGGVPQMAWSVAASFPLPATFAEAAFTNISAVPYVIARIV